VPERHPTASLIPALYRPVALHTRTCHHPSMDIVPTRTRSPPPLLFPHAPSPPRRASIRPSDHGRRAQWLTPLLCAARNKQPDMVALLVDKDANVKAANTVHARPKLLSCSAGCACASSTRSEAPHARLP
jgi:hypothetical protein